MLSAVPALSISIMPIALQAEGLESDLSGGLRPMFKVAITKEFDWQTKAVDGVSVYTSTHVSKAVLGGLVTVLDQPDISNQSLVAALQDLTGHFAIVIEHEDWVFACVDRIRSTPLIWCEDSNDRLVIASRGDALLGALQHKKAQPHREQALAIAMSGFTIGAETLYEDVYALLPGQFLLARKDKDSFCLTVERYHRYSPWRIDNQREGTDESARSELSDMTLNILEETVRRADGRPLLVPLSAGLDSRVIVSGLKKVGYRDVHCFAYGLAGNREAVVSKAIAEKLGYRWAFAPFTNRALARQFHSDTYQDYVRYADSLTSVHFPQDFPALSYLLESGYLPKDGVVLNGQSGDFISGNHIPSPLMTEGPVDEDGIDRVIDALLAKHFTQWAALNTGNNRRTVSTVLRRQIDELLPRQQQIASKFHPYGVYEECEFIDRQSKYVVNGQRAYEYLSLGWGLPLWHDQYLDFWSSQPLHRKANQTLYRQTMFANNWGGVWQDIPVNPTRIRPAWLLPVRHLLKLAHAPFGKSKWHRFEKRYLAYHMSSLCAYALKPWRDVAADSRRPRSAIALHIEAYLQRHDVDMNALAEVTTS